MTATNRRAADAARYAEVERHTEQCRGLPIFEQDNVGQWTATCSRCNAFNVTGCETKREAGARFYGGEQPGLYGVMGDGSRALELVERLAAQARALRKEALDLHDKQATGGGLTRMESNVLAIQTAQLNLLVEFVDPDTGEMR